MHDYGATFGGSDAYDHGAAMNGLESAVENTSLNGAASGYYVDGWNPMYGHSAASEALADASAAAAGHYGDAASGQQGDWQSFEAGNGQAADPGSAHPEQGDAAPGDECYSINQAAAGGGYRACGGSYAGPLVLWKSEVQLGDAVTLLPLACSSHESQHVQGELAPALRPLGYPQPWFIFIAAHR